MNGGPCNLHACFAHSGILYIFKSIVLLNSEPCWAFEIGLTRDTYYETGEPARLPAQEAGR
jgi:hypothetical protein